MKTKDLFEQMRKDGLGLSWAQEKTIDNQVNARFAELIAKEGCDCPSAACVNVRAKLHLAIDEMQLSERRLENMRLDHEKEIINEHHEAAILYDSIRKVADVAYSLRDTALYRSRTAEGREKVLRAALEEMACTCRLSDNSPDAKTILCEPCQALVECYGEGAAR